MCIRDRHRTVDDTVDIARSGLPPSETAENAVLEGYVTTVLAVNCQDHLRGVKRTRGGIGSARHDEGQKSIKTFFKRARKD